MTCPCCSPCSGSCDSENPCPEGCACVDGECVPCDCSATGFAPAIASDTERGLVYLEFSACIGSGAEGTVDAPQAASPCEYAGMGGAITGATLTDGGSGYAVLGRVEPTVTASVPGGSGAALSVTLAEGTDFLGNGCMEVPYWSVDSVSVTNGGSGYTDGQAVTFSAAAGDTVVEHAKAYAYVAIEAPRNAVVTVDTTGGSGAVLAPTFAVVSGTSISRGGAANPPFCNVPNRTAYQVTGITITNGGSGYAVDEFVEISFSNSSDGSVSQQLNAEVTAVTGSGEITAIGMTYGGRFGGGFTDTLDSVVVEGCIGAVGKYYREDEDEEPYVAEVTVTIQQEAPSTGNGAVITATVEDDPANEDFGKVASLTVQNGGTGYLDAASACGDLDTLYIEWGDLSTSINWRTHFGGIGGICGNDFRQNDGDIDGTEGPYCRGGAVNPFLGDAGNTTDFQLVTAFTPPACKCDGYLHMTFDLSFLCRECVATGGGSPSVSPESNKIRSRTVCVRFPMDESGCPVGDAEVVGWTVGSLDVVPDVPGNNACKPYTKHDNTYVSNDPCNCPTGCDVNEPPQISFMP